MSQRLSARCGSGSRGQRHKRAAEEVKRKLEAKLTLGEFTIQEAPQKAPTLGEYAEEWLDSYARHNCKESTYTRYTGVVRNYLLSAFGTRSLTEITRDDIKRYLSHLRATTQLTPSSLRNILVPLRAMLNHAVDDGVLSSNPAVRMGRMVPQRQHTGQEIIPLTRDELTLLLSTIQEAAPTYYPLFLCLARTGMRLGEVLALQWGDVDFRGRFIEIRQNYVRGRITRPKNGKTRRVDMSQQLTETLRHLFTKRKAETLQRGWRDMPEWVFCSEVGSLLDKENLRKRVFYRCLAKAGLRQVRIHDLRHTYASLLIQQGESLAYIKTSLDTTRFKSQ